jgi:hypothetical protein
VLLLQKEVMPQEAEEATEVVDSAEVAEEATEVAEEAEVDPEEAHQEESSVISGPQ